MQYISTRDPQQQAVSAAQAIRRGLALDGGLYVPQSFPRYQPPSWDDLDYGRLARDIFSLYLTDFSPEEIARTVDSAYGGGVFPPLVTPAVSVGAVEVLELFHGPTQAFKDVALQALPHLLTLSLRKCGEGRQAVVLAATSGDTGKAALEGFKDVAGCRVIVFYPAGGVSPIQERQMKSSGGANTTVISVEGNFDDCQSGVKRLFADTALNQRLAEAGLEFSSANSINFGRLLPQIVYYYHGYGQMVGKGLIRPGQEIQVVVPTGNFGNILAAYYAREMGLPLARLLCASNENDVLTEAIQSGLYNRKRPFYRTSSPSMDILLSSNFERFLFEMLGRDAAACADGFKRLNESGLFSVSREARDKWSGFLCAGMADQAQVQAAIGQVFRESGYVLDPHSAVGWAVWRGQTSSLPTLLAATASPFKFPAAVLTALGQTPRNSEYEQLDQLAALSGLPVPAALAALEKLPLRHQRHSSVAGMAREVEQVLAL